jgi:hypothetical protein
VAWEARAEGQPLTLRTPHPRDFLWVGAPSGTHTVRLTFTRHTLPRR